jgi:hypothetical protein
MPKYQIRFCDSKGHGSFTYIDVESVEGVELKAADKATEYITNGCGLRRGFFNTSSKPMRSVNVWEMDMETKEPKKKGHRFKLKLFHTTITYSSGEKERDEWYEPVVETKAAKS